jgi:hypothetical protein
VKPRNPRTGGTVHGGATTEGGRSNSTTLPRIGSPRARRALRLLAAREWVPSDELRRRAGALTISDLVHRLRVAGWEIVTRRVDAQDRDGHWCRPGEYRLTPEARRLAVRALSGRGGAR